MSRLCLDAIDRRLLAALQEDGRLTNVELAERVGLSPSPCLRRVRRLEDEGIVQAYRVTLDRRRLGLHMTVFVHLTLEPAACTQDVATTLRRLRGLVACHMVSGGCEYHLEIAVPDLASYDRLLTQHLVRLPGVRDIRSSFSVRTVAESLPLTLDHLFR